MLSSLRPRLLPVVVGIAALLAAMIAVPTQSPAAAAGQTEAPCDIYANGGTPCVAAFSTTRALFASYNGPLYRVQRTSDNATLDVGLLESGGYVNAAAQDAFCAGTTCNVMVIYDHTSRHNDLTVAGPGAGGPQNKPANAAALPITIAGHKAYGLFLPPVTGYRRASTVTTGTARAGQPESMYEVASGTNASDNCCSDFGNVETAIQDTGHGHMDTLNISFLNATESADPGPWVEADLEDGVWQGRTAHWANNRGNPSKFVTAVLRNNGQDTFSLKGGNAQGGSLSTWEEGPLPHPMAQEGSIILGVGGDNSNRATGTFFEGVMTAGYSSNATDDAVQANIVAQHYDGTSTGGGPGELISAPGGKCTDVYGNDIGTSGTVVDTWECRDLAADMHWVASDNYEGTLRTLGRCLSATGTTNGSAIQLADCSAAGGEVWRPQADGTVKNPASGRCLTAAGTTDGSVLQLADCTAGALQQFVVPVSIQHRGSCVDVAGTDNGGNNAVVQLWACQTIKSPGPLAKDQHWRYNVADHTIRTLGRCLSVAGNGTADQTHLLLNDCNGTGGQQWTPQADGTILNPPSGKCMSAVGAATANGTALQILGCGQVSTDKFQLN